MDLAYHFNLGDKVSLKLSGEEGEVVGRAHFNNAPPQYYLRFKGGDGCQRTGWFMAEDLIP